MSSLLQALSILFKAQGWWQQVSSEDNFTVITIVFTKKSNKNQSGKSFVNSAILQKATHYMATGIPVHAIADGWWLKAEIPGWYPCSRQMAWCLWVPMCLGQKPKGSCLGIHRGSWTPDFIANSGREASGSGRPEGRAGG